MFLYIYVVTEPVEVIETQTWIGLPFDPAFQDIHSDEYQDLLDHFAFLVSKSKS